MFAAALLIVVILLDRLNLLDLGTGNATAKDGDSLILNAIEVRLHGIDAPEFNQTCNVRGDEYACGRDAAAALRNLLRGRMINCTALDTDRYGRAVSICRDGDTEVNREMVRQGWAIAYIGHSIAYVKVQQEAKSAKRGVWQGSFEMPEDYRARHRKSFGDITAASDIGD